VPRGDRMRRANFGNARPVSTWEGIIGNKNLLRGAAREDADRRHRRERAAVLLKLADVRAVVAVGQRQGRRRQERGLRKRRAALCDGREESCNHRRRPQLARAARMLGLKPLRRFAPNEEIDPASVPWHPCSGLESARRRPTAGFSFIETDEPPPPVPSRNGARPLEVDHRETIRRLLDRALARST